MEKLIKGEVIKGNGLGGKLGFPTLNFLYDGELRGVYVVEVFVDGEWRRGGAHFGARPTINDNRILCEVHILDWSGDYKGEIKVKVLKKIRDVCKFKNLEELADQIRKDLVFVKNI